MNEKLFLAVVDSDTVQRRRQVVVDVNVHSSSVVVDRQLKFQAGLLSSEVAIQQLQHSVQ